MDSGWVPGDAWAWGKQCVAGCEPKPDVSTLSGWLQKQLTAENSGCGGAGTCLEVADYRD